MEPDISIVTLLWRNADYATAFLTSVNKAVAALAGRATVELILVVNGPDGKEAEARLRAHGLSPVLNSHWVHSCINEGFAGGVERGLRCASGDILVVLNFDTTVDYLFLDRLCTRASHRWDILIPSVTVSAGGTNREVGAMSFRLDRRLKVVSSPHPGRVSAGSGSCLIVRRGLVTDRVSEFGTFFDPEFHSFGEDLDLFLWCRARAYVRFAPEIMIRHYWAGSFSGRYRYSDREPAIRVQIMANYRLAIWKNARGVQDWVGWVAGEAATIGRSLFIGPFDGTMEYLWSWRRSFLVLRQIRARRGQLRRS